MNSIPQSLKAQESLVVFNDKINLDTIPWRIIDGIKQPVIVFHFMNKSGKAMDVHEISTDQTDYYYSNYKYIYQPGSLISPGQRDSIVVAILPDSANPFYFVIHSQWILRIRYDDMYSKEINVRWNSSNLNVGVKYPSYKRGEEKLVYQGNAVEFKYLLYETNPLDIIIDSIEYYLNDRIKLNKYVTTIKTPLTVKRLDSIWVTTLFETYYLTEENSISIHVFFHYPNGQSTSRRNSGRFNVIPEVNFELDKSNHDFGNINQGEIATKEFLITNKGMSIINLSSGYCADFENSVLQPDSSTIVRFGFDTRFDTGYWHKNVVIGARVNGFKYFVKTTEIGFSGNIQPALDLTNQSFSHFGDTTFNLGNIGRTGDARVSKDGKDLYYMDSVYIQNLTNYTLTEFDVDRFEDESFEDFMIGTNKKTLVPGDSLKLYIIFKIPNLKNLNFRCNLKYDIEYNSCTMYHGSGNLGFQCKMEDKLKK